MSHYLTKRRAHIRTLIIIYTWQNRMSRPYTCPMENDTIGYINDFFSFSLLFSLLCFIFIFFTFFTHTQINDVTPQIPRFFFFFFYHCMKSVTTENSLSRQIIPTVHQPLVVTIPITHAVPCCVRAQRAVAMRLGPVMPTLS